MDKPLPSRFPRISQAELDKRLADIERDDEERRTLSGRHASPKGKCVACDGDVVARVTFPVNDRLGGPPTNGYIDRWSCDSCHLVYDERPPTKKRNRP